MRTNRFLPVLLAGAAAAVTAILGASASALPRSNRGQATFAPDKGTFTILVNGKVITLDLRSSVAQAIAIRDGKIGDFRQIGRWLPCIAF